MSPITSDAIKALHTGQLSDEELFEEIRDQVNRSRHGGGHQRDRTREIAAEAQKRDWNLRRPSITTKTR